MKLDWFCTTDFENIDNVSISSCEKIKIDELVQQLKESVQYGSALQYYDIKKLNERQIKKFMQTSANYMIKFKNLPNNFHDLQQILYNSVDEILNNMLSQRSYVRLVIFHEALDTPIGLPFMKREDLTTEMVLTRFFQVSQSKRDLKLDDKLQINTSIIDIIEGKGSRFEDYVTKKQSIIQIKNEDNLCAVRAIAVGIALAESKRDYSLINEYKQIINNKQSKKQTLRAQELAKAIGFNQDMTATLDIIKKVEEYIKNYQILIISKDEDYQFVYVGSQKDDQIILLHKNNHYDLITSLPGFFESRKFCFKC